MTIYANAHEVQLTSSPSKGGPVSESQVLDCRGMACPLPVVKTSQAIKEIEIGQVLTLLATDPGVEPDMHAWTERTHNELVSISQDNGVFTVLIRRLK
jgi:tRNA 2-thiouridine synthesizing protein A